MSMNLCDVSTSDILYMEIFLWQKQFLSFYLVISSFLLQDPGGAPRYILGNYPQIVNYEETVVEKVKGPYSSKLQIILWNLILEIPVFLVIFWHQG
jgi:hypothetical protein